MHTPTPWRIHSLYPEEIYATVDGKRMQVADVSGACSADQDVINAAFIVEAVNSHGVLVRALEVALNELSYLGAKHGYVSTETAIVRVTDALTSIKVTA